MTRLNIRATFMMNEKGRSSEKKKRMSTVVKTIRGRRRQNDEVRSEIVFPQCQEVNFTLLQ